MQVKRILSVAIVAGALVAGMGPGAHAEMKQRNVARYSVSVLAPVALDAVRVQAGPRAQDLRYYDIQLTVAGEAQPLISVFTGDTFNRPRIDQEILRTAPALADIHVDVHYLYDAAHAVCAASVGSTCGANLPFDPTDLGSTAITSTSKAEVVIETGFGANGTDVTVAPLRIPFVGQVTAIVPNNASD
jgi:hypothetical protein